MKSAVVYWNGTGNTEAMAQAVAEGMTADFMFVSSFLLMILYDQTATASCSSFEPLCQSAQ